MTTVTAYFNSPFLLGFEPLERLLERTAKSAGDSYPPYNIEATEDGGIAITLAVAGFAKDDIAVTVEDRQLVIRGRQNEAGRQNVPSSRHRGATIFTRFRAGRWHRSQICRVGKWIAENNSGAAGHPTRACGS